MKPFELIIAPSSRADGPREKAEAGTEIDRRRCQVVGYLDAHTVLQFEEEMNDLLDSGATQVLVDLSELNYISSSGIGAIMGLTQKLRQAGGELVLVNPTEKVSNILDLLGFNKVFKIVASDAEALEFFEA